MVQLILRFTADMISGFDSSAEGTTHVYVEYKGKQVVYSMEVVAPKTSDISSIVISGQPKKSYVEGDVFNPSRASMYANDWWSCSLYLQWIYL